MRRIFAVTLIFCLFFGASFWYAQTADICPAPIKYRVGEVDKRFGITNDELKKLLFDAELAWEDPTKRELFVYDEGASFTVNLIYDERQQMVHTEEEWRTALDKQEKESKLIMSQVEELSAKYRSIKDEYDRKRDDYESSLSKYNSQVEEYNQKGGAPTEEFDRLKNEQKKLNKVLNELVLAEKGMSKLSNEINDLGNKSNEIIKSYNSSVERYNELFGKRDVFTQGDFQRERINVYKFESSEELERVIIHEFGHSLGIQHVEGTDSIMYYLMTEQSGAVILSEEDKNAFIAVCGAKEDFSSEVRQVIRGLLSIF